MGRIISFILVLTAIIGCLSGCGLLSDPLKVRYEDMGIPSKDNYREGSAGLYISDMAFYDGKLYIGDGDYGANTGPVNVMAYNYATGAWENTGTLSDEAIKNFVVIDGKLYAPGTDPKDEWSFGNYYYLDGGEWQTVRTIPDGIHNFDMISFDGAMYAAIGTPAGGYPVVRSDDGGASFYSIEMRRDGTALDTSEAETNRCFDLFSVGGSLYVTYFYYREATDDNGKSDVRYELYRYDSEENAFVYHTNLLGNMKVRTDYGTEFTKEHLIFADAAFVVTGALSYSEDMTVFSTVNFPDDRVVWDICVYDDVLYVLCSLQTEDGAQEISVWKNPSGKPEDFEKILWFKYDIYAVSFAFDGEYSWFGMYNNTSEHKQNGRVLRVNFNKK